MTYDDHSMDAALSDERRLTALAESGLLDTPSEEAFDRLARFAGRMLDAPVSLITLVEENRQFFKSHVGLPDAVATHRETPLSHSFCKHVVQSKAPLRIDDAATDPIVNGNLAITELGVASYIGVPVQAPDGSVLGSVCVIDMKPRHWSDDEMNIMKDLAQIVNAEIELRAEVRLRTKSEDRLQLLAKELTHRIKNIFTLTSGIVSLSAREKPELQSFVDDVTGRLHALAKAQDYVQMGEAGAATNGTLSGLIKALLSPYPQSRLSIEGDDTTISETTANGMTFILHELATNALKYGAWSNSDGQVRIDIRSSHGRTTLIWHETGGPAIAEKPTRQGYGSRMMIHSAKAYFNGDVVSDWQPGGLCATVTLNTAAL